MHAQLLHLFVTALQFLHGPALLDVSLTHPRAATYVTDAATIQGSAAVKRDALKYRGHNGHYHPGCTFIPASMATCGYLGQPLLRYLKTVSEVAAALASSD